MELKFGKFKGRTIEDISNSGDEGLSYLDWLGKNTDVNDPKYGAKNKAMVAEIKRCMSGKTFVVRERKTKTAQNNDEVIDILVGMDEKIGLIMQALKIKLPETHVEKKDDLPF